MLLKVKIPTLAAQNAARVGTRHVHVNALGSSQF